MKQIKTIKALAKELCAREGKKKQVNIAQMSETLGHLSDIFFESSNSPYPTPGYVLYKNGDKRAKKKAKSCKK